MGAGFSFTVSFCLGYNFVTVIFILAFVTREALAEGKLGIFLVIVVTCFSCVEISVIQLFTWLLKISSFVNNIS